MDKGLLTSQNALEISIFLKSLDQVPADEIFSRLLSTSIFLKYLCKYNLVPVSLTASFERGPNQTQCLIWLSLAALWGVVTSPPGTLTACSPPAFQDTFTGHRLRPRAPSWQEKWNPAGLDGETLVVVGHKCSAGEETNQHYKPFLVHLPEQISI